MTIPHPLWNFPENSSDLLQPPFPKLDREKTHDKHTHKLFYSLKNKKQLQGIY